MSLEEEKRYAISRMHDVIKKRGISVASLRIIFLSVRDTKGVTRNDVVLHMKSVTANNAGVMLHRLKEEGYLKPDNNGSYHPTEKSRKLIAELHE
jgi:Mn-dependent DtxR family transcriptional regulator